MIGTPRLDLLTFRERFSCLTDEYQIAGCIEGGQSPPDPSRVDGALLRLAEIQGQEPGNVNRSGFAPGSFLGRIEPVMSDNRYPQELRDRAVRLVLETRDSYPSLD